MPELTQLEISQWGLWLQTGALIASFIGVAWTVHRSKVIARRRATLDFVLAEQTDPDHLTLRNRFVKLRESGDLTQYAKPSKATDEANSTIRAILNRYELVAIGIREDTIDERSYKRWCRSTLVKDWTECKPFIMEIRRNAKAPKIFCELEWLAEKWANKDEKDHI